MASVCIRAGACRDRVIHTRLLHVTEEQPALPAVTETIAT
jgi:hypothetical protein